MHGVVSSTCGQQLSDVGNTVKHLEQGFSRSLQNKVNESYFYTLINLGKDVNVFYDFDFDGKKEHLQLSTADLALPAPKHRYLAGEFTLEDRPSEDLQVLVSYVWSHSWGMTEGLVRTDNGQADPGWTTSYDYADLMDHGAGDLPNGRRHVLKLSGIYDVNDDWNGKPAPRGSAGNLDWLYEVDLSLTYLTSVAGGDLTVKGTIYNLFNFDTPLRVYDVAQVINTDSSFAASPDSGVATRL